MRAAIRGQLPIDENEAVALHPRRGRDPGGDARPDRRQGARLVTAVRRERLGKGGIDAFLHEYALSSPEGVALMCLAEALLRIPDAETVDRLIRDKLGEADWARHLGQSESVFVNASTWALMLTGRLLHDEPSEHDLRGALRRFVARSGEPVVRQAVTAAMRILGRQFVMGRTIEEALDRARAPERQGFRYSYDMLGEAARTAADAARYFAAYDDAIAAIGRVCGGPGRRPRRPASRSSCRRCTRATRWRSATGCWPSWRRACLELARHAPAAGIGFTIDAEEADRLELSLDLVEALALAPRSRRLGWARPRRPGLSEARVAAASTGSPISPGAAAGGSWCGWSRAPIGTARSSAAQEHGLDGYPVYTRKVATDVSYLACARRLLDAGAAFYPQFATHNAHTVAAVLELAGDRRDCEFQRLHGMGEALYDQIVGPEHLDRPCRVYAPVGSHEDLLAYLVRRLLENGANTSFVNRIVDEQQPIDEIIADPVARLAQLPAEAASRASRCPRDLYGPERRNSRGLDLNDPTTLAALREAMIARIAPPVAGGADHRRGRTARRRTASAAEPVLDPSDRRRRVGRRSPLTRATSIGRSLVRRAAAPDWERTPAGEARRDPRTRRRPLRGPMAELMALIIREGGRTIPAALSEVREAVDYLRYYARRARADFADAGAPARPDRRAQRDRAARARRLCLHLAVEFPAGDLHRPDRRGARRRQCGRRQARRADARSSPRPRCGCCSRRASPAMCCICCPAPAKPSVRRSSPIRGSPGSPSPARPRPRGGSTSTLARRPGPIVPLIAETGGQNAMIVDSSALAEQVVADVLTSAFDSAGQRCSALRLLYVQDDIADRLLAMLAGAMAELAIGDPALLATDVGPVIDEAAREALAAPCRADDARRPADLPLRPAAGHRARHLLRAARLRDRQRRRGSTARSSARSCMSSAGRPTGSTRCSTRSTRPATA